MCGIAGLLQRDGRPVDRAQLERMATRIAHRGPDGAGFHLDGGRPSVGLASRRLAVIDISGGAQPMATEDGACTIVYNGEVFNAPELRAELEGHGHRFRSRCDTEVVLRGYVQWGPEVLGRLNGMWGFALWDRPRRRLFLARDRLGVKPVVYSETGSGTLVFASEIKALLASGLVERRLDPAALPHYLSSFTVPEPGSFFAGVRRLPAGHYLLADAGGTRTVRYWDCALEEEEDRGAAAYQEEIGALLADAVKRRLVSDVPLGVFLSGGIDSGLMAALAARETAALRTFTVGFEGSADERPAARRLARALGARHSEEGVGAREAAAALPALLEASDEPLQSLVQSHFVSRLARRDVTVALAGIGGDELFSSYPTHRVVHMLARFDRLPAPLRRLALSLAPLHARGRSFARLAALAADERVSRRLLQQTEGDLRARLLHPDLAAGVDLEAPVHALQEHLARALSRDPLNRVLYVYVKTYLADELLRAADSMSMAHSLEVRVPMLDYRLVERALQIPAAHKMTARAGKVLLRRLARTVLPPGSVERVKRGFALPLAAWLRGPLTEMVRDVLAEPAVRRRGVFAPEATARLVEACLEGQDRLSQAVLMLLSFELWARRVLDAAPAAPEPRPPSLDTAPVPPARAPELTVIVVNWNTQGLLRDCLTTVAAYLKDVRHEVIVVDNASADGSADMVAREFPAVRLIRNPENVGFARANNQAMRVAAGEWFMLLNSDTRLTDDSVARLFASVRGRPGLGVAHCRLLLEDGRVQYSTYRFPSVGLSVLEGFGFYKLLPPARRGELLLSGYWEEGEERDVDWVSGAFMLMPRAVFEQTGGFSEEFFMYGEDLEWCYRIRAAGFSIRHFPQASLIHLDHSSSNIRWGERRIALCLKSQLEIHGQRHGRLAQAALHGTGVAVAAFRAAYFGLRGLRGGRGGYDREMLRYYLYSLRTYARLLRGRT
jgi:asparagine synthase (glutamine-hydrolysing)